MRAGTLSSRVMIQHKVGGTDPWGSPLPASWEDLMEVWADVRHLSGMETLRADAVTSTVQASIRIRKRPGRSVINAGMRIIHDGIVYDIKAILPGPLRYNKYLDILCATTGATPE